MMKNEKNDKLKIAGAAAITLLAVAGIAGGMVAYNHNYTSEDVDRLKAEAYANGMNAVDVTADNAAVIKTAVDAAVAGKVSVVEYNAIVAKLEAELAKPEITTTVTVDNENLDVVLEHIYDNNGNVNYLVDDLEDDELDLIVERIVFSNEAKTLAVEEAKKEISDLLDKEEFVFGGVTVKFDEDDLERIKVQSDDEDVVIADIDFDDNDADVEVEVYFEQDDVKYKALVVVEIKDSEVEDISLKTVELR